MKPALAIAEEFRHYAYAVSHDVSAPVRAMIEFSRLLSEEEPNALSMDGREYLSLIVENGRKLQAMMDGLLLYSRVNTQAGPMVDVDAGALVAQVVSAAAAKIRQSRAVIVVEPLPLVYADEWQLKQVFAVLIDNALTFQQHGQAPQVRIGAERVAGNWRFFVADNGIGVPPAFSEAIFQLFKRLHTDEEYPGVGAGLAVAHKIIERHGGMIRCEANVPQGAVFAVSLPAGEA